MESLYSCAAEPKMFVRSSGRFGQHHVTERHLFASGGHVDEHAGRRADLEF